MRELAADGIAVALTCRVLGLARQPCYRWLAAPVPDTDLAQAYRANALFDAHRDDPEFGCRYLVAEAASAGEVMAERTAWRICRDGGWWSVFGKKRRGKGGRGGPPVHDDLVCREFTTTTTLDQLWFADITDHHQPRRARRGMTPRLSPIAAADPSLLVVQRFEDLHRDVRDEPVLRV